MNKKILPKANGQNKPATLDLSEDHRTQLLVDSAIAPEVVAARGYQTVTTKARLREAGFGEAQRIVPAILIPMYTLGSELATYQSRPDMPRVVGDRVVKYESVPRSAPLVDVHPFLTRPQPDGKDALINDVSVPLLVTEGVKKSDCAISIGLCCVTLLGVSAWRHCAFWNAARIKGRKLFICYDNDVALKLEVWREMAKLTEFLKQQGAEILYIYLPRGEHGAKIGLDDWAAARHAEGLTKEQIRSALFELATDTLIDPPQSDHTAFDGRPKITIKFRHVRDLTDEALDAIRRANDKELPEFFVQSTAMVRLRVDIAPPVVEPLGNHSLRGALDRVANWTNISRSGKEYPDKVPVEVVSDILSLPGYNGTLPKLTTVATTPFFNANGDLIAASGYHQYADTYLYLAPELSIPALSITPSAADIARAKHLLITELLGDFRFASACGLPHTLAVLLYGPMRQFINTHAPLYVTDAPTAGSGKGLIMDCASITLTGGPVVVIAETKDEEEMRKKVTSQLMCGASFVLFDNIRRIMDSGAFAAVLTSDVWGDRILGGLKDVKIDNRVQWAATGNNLRFTGEMLRRTIPARIDVGMEHPEMRLPSAFRHADLRTWAKQNRGELLWAVLTLVRNWFAQGAPRFNDRALGSFENWSQIVGGVLAAAGIEGFLAGRELFADSGDTESAAFRTFINAWFDVFQSKPVTVNDLITLAKTHLALAEEDRSSRTILGGMLGKRRDNVFGNYKLVAAPYTDDHGRSRSGWKLVAVDRQPTTEASTDNLPTTPAEDKAERPPPDAANPDARFQPIPPDAYIFSQLRNLGRTILTIEEYERLEREQQREQIRVYPEYGMMCDREEAFLLKHPEHRAVLPGPMYYSECPICDAEMDICSWVGESTIIARCFNGCSKEMLHTQLALDETGTGAIDPPAEPIRPLPPTPFWETTYRRSLLLRN